MYDAEAPLLDSSGFERNVHLLDADARAWMARRAYAVSRAPTFWLRADSYSGTEIRLARLTHPAAVISPLTRTAAESGPRTRMVLPRDFPVKMSRGADLVVVPGGAAVLLQHGDQFALEALSTTSRAEIDLKYDVYERYGLPPMATLLLEDSMYVRAISALISMIFTPEVVDGPSSANHLKIAIENLTVSVLQHTLGAAQASEANLNMGLTELRNRAFEAVQSRSGSSELTVATLAHGLGVSERYLRIVFASAGTSPSRAIREARVRTARELMIAIPPGVHLDMNEIALRSGFSSARTLRSALEKTPKADSAELSAT